MEPCRQCGSPDLVTIHQLVVAKYPISEFMPEDGENQPVDPTHFVFDHFVDIPLCEDCLGSRTMRRRILAAAGALGLSYFTIIDWLSGGAGMQWAWVLLAPVLAGWCYVIEHRSAPGNALDAILHKLCKAPPDRALFTMREWGETPHA